ncbi:MAG TPA: metalloregulator ArsR/SmtB family transcription factor [Candidatus Dormibacteraeota bacterium]|nr:metalloregulator ArsR/SmtB family transcription factor [Candidatus Dormibacteraeota bacterium]
MLRPETRARDQLSLTFAALADPTRRAILARLAHGEATVNELAEPFTISLQAVCKHLKVLERAGLIPRWWGREGHDIRVDRMEVRPGGIWRFVETGADGHQHAFRGVYHSVAPEQTGLTFVYEGAPGHVALQTLTLDEIDGRTRYQATSVFQSIEDRDAVVMAGMEVGARESMNQLAALVRELA